MNVPQSYIAKAEVYTLMSIKDCTISEKNGTVINGLIQDAVLGLYLLSQDRTMLSRSQRDDIIAAAGREWRIPQLMIRAQEYNMNIFSGKVVLSCLFPEDFNFKKIYDVNKVVEIVNGILVTGILTKNVLSEDDGSIIQVLTKRYGMNVATEFQSAAYPLSTAFLSDAGFSFGYADCDPGREVDAAIKGITEKVRQDVIHMYDSAKNQGVAVTDSEKLETLANTKISSAKAKVDKLLLDTADQRIIRLDRSGAQKITGAYAMYTAKGRLILPSADMQSIYLNYNNKIAYYTTNNNEKVNIPIIGLISVSIVSNDGKDMHTSTYYWYAQKSFLAMTESKSKGNFNNYTQVAGIVSQQSLSGKRIQRTLANNTVTLPHFEQSVRDPVAEGFVNYGYLHGVPALQYYIHGMAARQAVIETAATTPDTGYLTRKLAKLLENNVAQFDGTIRTTSYTMIEPDGTEVIVGSKIESATTMNEKSVGGPIVQFNYGTMGFTLNKMVRVPTINGGTIHTFSDIKSKIAEIKSRARSTNAYVMFIGENDYKEAIVSLYYLHLLNLRKVQNSIVNELREQLTNNTTKQQSNYINDEIETVLRANLTTFKSNLKKYTSDVVAIVNPKVPLSFQTAINDITTRMVVFDYGNPTWAYNLIEYTRVAIIDPLQLLISLLDPINTQLINLLEDESTSISLVIPELTDKYYPESLNKTKSLSNKNALKVIASMSEGSSTGIVIVTPSIQKYNIAYEKNNAMDWLSIAIETEGEIGNTHVNIMNPRWVVRSLTDLPEPREPKGYFMKPIDSEGILSVNDSLNNGTEIWYKTLQDALYDYNYLSKYYPS